MKQILLTTWIIGVGIAVGIGLISLYGIGHPTEVLGQALRIITAPQGGTGISTSSPADIGKCIMVLDDSPFTYKLDSCGGLGSDPTVIQIDGAAQSVDSPTLNYTSNSFTVVENPDDTFTLRVATTTLGLLSTNVGEGSNLYYTDARARAAITESVLGLEFNSGVLGTTTGYFVPTTTRAGTWDTAYSWGNHALSGYISDGTPYIFDRYGKTGWDMDAYQTVSYSFATTTRTFTLTPTGTDFSFWIQGVKYTYAATSTTITDTEGNWFIYFDINGVLQSSQTPWVIGNNDKAFVVSIYWDATNDKAIIIDNEMHSWVMDASVHRIMHSTFGTRYGTGLAVTINGANLDVGAGAIYDEDIKIDIVDDDTPDTIWEQQLTPASVPVYYRVGANGDWRVKASSTAPVFLDGTAMYINTFSTVWATTTVTNNQYVAYWVLSSGDISNPVFVIPGQETGASLAAARSGNLLSDMQFGNLPVQEFKVIARVIVKKIAGAPYYSLIEVADYRNVSDEPSTSFSGTDHGGLTGLLDDDHTQYLLADGTRSLTASWFPGNYSIYGLNSLTLTGTSTLGFASSTALTVSGNSWLNLASTTALTVSGQTWLANASTTAVSGTNTRFTNGYFTNSSLGFASSTSLTVANNVWLNLASSTALTATRLFATNSALTYASTTSFGSTGNAWLTYASSTGMSGANLNFTNATTSSFFSALGSFTNIVVNTLATFLNMVVTGLLDVGGGVLEIPNGTAPTVDSIGELAFDSTSNQLVLFGTEKKVIGNGNDYTSFTYATTTAWTGTTTLPLGPSFVAETWNGIQCYTDAGTLVVQVGDGTNWTNANQASTTVGTTVLSTNNTFTAAEKRYWRAGTPASSPTIISCTISRSLTSD